MSDLIDFLPYPPHHKQTMKYRLFKKSQVKASEIGFGLWTLATGWWGQVSDEEAVRLLQKAFELGVTFYDTADGYGDGRGERLLAQAFSKKRNEIVISTKFGYDFYHHASARRGQQEIPQNFSPDYIRFACEESLRRLETDHIDFYQIHNAKMDAVESDELFKTLDKLKSEGKILSYGAALGPAIGWLEEGVRLMKERDISGLHTIYNLFEQEPARQFFPAARESGVGILVRVPHSSGLLEGKYTKDTIFDKSDHRAHRNRKWLLEGLEKLKQIQFLTDGTDRTMGQSALKFVLSEPSVTTVLPNIYNEEQLTEFASTSEKTDLSQEELQKLEELYQRQFYLSEQGIVS